MYSILESTPQFHTDPLSSHIGSTQGPHLFSTQNPSIQHQKPLSSTHLSVQHTRQFNTPVSSTPNNINIGLLRLQCVKGLF